MKNFDYAKKYHYMIKYLIIGLPIIILLVYLFSLNGVSDLNGGLTAISDFTDDFMSWSINNWYDNLLTSLNVTWTNSLINIIIHLPVYILWVYVFDLIFDVIAIIPRLAHKFITKVGGDY